MKAQRGRTPRKRPPFFSHTEPVEVYCRIKPVDATDSEAVCLKPISNTQVQLYPTEMSIIRNGALKEMVYTFQYVFDESTSQKAVFDLVAAPLVEDLIKGKNSLLFTYGITCSGKTYTMTGAPQDQGILPRCLDVLFNSIGNFQAKKYVFKSDKMNGFEIQSEADAMMERQRKDILPGIKTPRKKKSEFVENARVKELQRVDSIDEDCNYAVFISYIEIYNNYVYDLLEELPYDNITGYKPPQSKILREDSNKMMYVNCCVEVEVKSPDEAFEVLYKGQKRRKVAHTALNAESSRSHSVFNIRLVQAPLDPRGEEVLQDSEKVCVSQLSLVDLAGSERTVRTKNAGDRLKEAGNINQSLMVLRSCIEILRENQKTGSNKMVPYRDSKMTHLFKTYFDGDGKVRMIVCVNPRAEEYEETIHVMKFAELTREVLVQQIDKPLFSKYMPPGRRQLNQDYREMVAKMQSDETAYIPGVVYNLGKPFPSLHLTHPSDDELLATLINYLEEYVNRRSTYQADLARRQEAFRNMIVAMEKELTSLRSENRDLMIVCGKKDAKIKHLEQSMSESQRHLYFLEKERLELDDRLQDKDLKIRLGKDERERLKADFQTRMEIHNHRWEKNMEWQKKKIETECGAELLEKQRKLNLLKSIVNDPSSDSSTDPPVTPLKTPRKFRTYTTPAMTTPGRYRPEVAPRPWRPTGKINTARSMQNLNQVGGTPRTTVNPPPYNPRHRRSKSSSHAETWLNHRPSNQVELGTVLQPKLRKKHSVTKLTVKDTKEASKYCLTHQDLGSDGELQTKFYKGNILPTAGGGSAVVLDDVETLKQTSPGSRKRRSSASDTPVVDGEWTDTETRCAVGIEGHPLKKNKQSAV